MVIMNNECNSCDFIYGYFSQEFPSNFDDIFTRLDGTILYISFTISFPVWLSNRKISAGLKPVFSHTEKLCIASTIFL